VGPGQLAEPRQRRSGHGHRPPRRCPRGSGPHGQQGAELTSRQTATTNGELNGAATTWSSEAGTFVAVRVEGGQGLGCTNGGAGNLVLLRVGAGPTLLPAWCSADQGLSVPITTMSAPGQDVVVWAIGSNQLHAYHGETGAELLAGGAGDAVTAGSSFMTPIVAKGRVYVAAHAQLFAFTP
jgi:hypothetical protein